MVIFDIWCERRRLVGVVLLLLVGMVGGLSAQTAGGGPGEGDSVDILDPSLPLDSLQEGDPTAPTGTAGSSSRWVDSVFVDGRMIRLTVRIADEIRRDTARLRALLDSIERGRQATIAANLNLNPEEWRPTERDIAEREENIRRAQDFEYIYPQDIARVPVMSVPLSSIGQALGLVEDTSPRISYRLEATRKVTVIVYTVLDALEIVRLVDRVQSPGVYSFDWDFNDSSGRRVLPGSYIVEVIADSTEMLLRKRVVVP